MNTKTMKKRNERKKWGGQNEIELAGKLLLFQCGVLFFAVLWYWDVRGGMLESPVALGGKCMMMKINYVEVMAVIVSSLTFEGTHACEMRAHQQFVLFVIIQWQPPHTHTHAATCRREINCAVARFEFKINATQFCKCHT